MLHIGIVDDHSIIRAGFRDMITDHGGSDLQVTFEADTGEVALDALRDVECDVLLLDISLPGQNGVEVLRQVRKDYETLRVLILSSYPEDRYASAMIRQGASGYLCKDCDGKQLVQAIRTVGNGKRYLSPSAVHILADQVTSDSKQQPHETLSDRELQVFFSLAKGDSATNIAHNLGLSIKTISTYRTRLMEKLGASSNAELAAYAVRNGLIAS